MLEPSESLEKLKMLREEGKLHITYLDHLPRTISHALERCLFEAFDGQANEPFFVKEYNGTQKEFTGFEPGATTILDEYERRREELGDTERPVTLLVKDVAKSFPPEAFDVFLGAVQNVVSLVRDPHVQMYSLMEAIVGDYLTKPRFGEEAQKPETPSKEVVLNELGEKAAYVLRWAGTEDVNTTSWKPMGAHLAMMDYHMDVYPEKEHIILDGNFLRLRPEEAVQEVVDRIAHVEFKPEMLTDWKKSRGGFENERDWGKSAMEVDGKTENVWTNNAFKADGFRLPDKTSTPVFEFPKAIQSHILDDALPIHADAMRHPNRIGAKTSEELRELLETKVREDGTRFMDINPTSAYMFTATLPEEAGLEQQQALLRDIRENSPEHTLSFDRIDAIVAEKEKPAKVAQTTERPALVLRRELSEGRDQGLV